MANRLFRSKCLVGFIALIMALGTQAQSKAAKSELPQSEIDCTVVVVGGGVSGLYTVYELSKKPWLNPKSICLFEKDSRLGGRVYDVAMDNDHPELVFGLGALRVLEGQDEIFALARELGVSLVAMPYQGDLINTRGIFSFSSDEINIKAYQNLSKSFINSNGRGTEDALWSWLFENRSSAHKYAELRSFARDVLPKEGFQFLHDISRFRADFTRPINIEAFFQYYQEEDHQGVVPWYPIGGMSQFVVKMAEASRDRGVQVFMNEPVLHVEKLGRSYEVKTDYHVTQTKLVVFALDPLGLGHVKGPMSEAIQSQKQFRDLMPIEVVSINQKWPLPWWQQSGYEGKTINRAWTTEHCLNFIEIPLHDYGAKQLVTRTVYSDAPGCNEFWKETMEKKGIKAIEEEIMRGLRHLFPKASIPSPTTTLFQVWPAGWYWLRGSSDYSVEDIAAWAVKPLEGENIAVVGDAYFIKRSGWIDGAVRSAQNFLKTVNEKTLDF